MITELVPEDPPVKGGKSIKTHIYRVKHFRLQKALRLIAALMIGNLEASSNNTAGEVSARVSRRNQRAITDIKREIQWAIDKKDDPTAPVERVFTIQVPQPSELEVMPNIKLNSVNWELDNLFAVILGSQATDESVWLGDGSEEDIKAALATAEERITELLGTGLKDDGGAKFNTGVAMASYPEVGRLNPPVSSPTVELHEASSDNKPSRFPDAQDTAS